MKKINIKQLAQALIQIGQEENIFEQLLDNLKNVQEKINLEPDYKHYLNDPHVSLKEKRKALEVIFGDFISHRTYNFILILLKYKALGYLDEVIDYAGKHYYHVQNIVEIIAESVVPLKPEQEKQLLEIFGEKLGKQVIVKNLINHDVLGGLRLHVGDQIIDASLRGRLQALKDKIANI